MYHYTNTSTATVEQAEALIGKPVTLPLTGIVADVIQTDGGVCVLMEVDERWGLAPGTRLGFDLEAYTLDT